MGAHTSDLRQEDIEELEAVTVFKQKEIKSLYKRFKRLDKDNSGTISTDEFQSIPELAMNPLAPRIIAIFDTNKDDQVNFKQFVQRLSVFSSKGSKKDKMLVAFKIYDINDDGFVTPEEIFKVLKMMVGNSLSDEHLNQIVEKTVADSDKDGDGKISFAEFSQLHESCDIETKMSIKF
eukprot:TRINITY_DN7097_c0_g1_i2.p1 TRINITY_DN7097_c0_g1~~TRINITY_DN7097_c0_g1_i2.p1  ORF type:complete len:191 (-),score=43.37 TRINITY_DN7097_c0_g1_i2:6-539(-)